MPRLTPREYLPGDEHVIGELFRAVFGRDRSIAEWRWRFVDGPAENVQIHVFEADDKVVGHTASVGFPTFVDGERVLCRQSGDGMVLPEYQKHGGFSRFLREQDESQWDVTQTFSTERSARGVMSVRKRWYGKTTQWVRAHDGPGRAFAETADLLRPRRPVGVLPDPGTDIDELAARSARFAPCIRIRDGRYLRWRWLDQPGPDFQLLAARTPGGELRGVAAFGIDTRCDPPWRGRVVDLLADTATATTALLIAAARALEVVGCTRVCFDYHDPRPWSRAACYRAGFAPRGEGLITIGGSTSSGRESADRFENWYLTRGDSDYS